MSSVPDPVAEWARRRGDAVAVEMPGAAWTWRELDARVGACAARVRELAEPGRGEGALRGLAVQAPTSRNLVVVVLAALRAGIVVAPLSPRWPAAATATALQRLALGRLATDGAAPAGVETVGLVRLAAPGNAAEAPPLDPARAWTVIHTSGSTGTPKAALHTVGNHLASAHGVNERLGLDAGDRWWLDLPLDHVGGLGVVVRCVLAGATVCLPGRAPLADALAALRPTHASLVATQLGRWLDARDAGAADLGSLRAVLVGGSAVAPGLLDRAVAAGLPVATSYGMTEMTATVCATPPGAPREALATSGAPLAGREVRIGADGEIRVRGASRFVGYLAGPLVSAHAGAGLVRPFDADGWYLTGDLGTLDEAGRLVVTGRRDLQFVSGGENVQPEAIERVLARHGAVAEAVVVPVPDAAFGARPVAFVRLAPGASLDGALRAELDAAVRAELPGFMAPDAIHAWQGPAGLKADRPALAREAERRAAAEG